MWTETTRSKYDRRTLHYASDLTDAEWGVIGPLLLPGKMIEPIGLIRAGIVAARTRRIQADAASAEAVVNFSRLSLLPNVPRHIGPTSPLKSDRRSIPASWPATAALSSS